MPERPAVGSIGWFDLTVDDAPRVRDFYQAVVGWDVQDVPMEGGAYSDYCMVPPGASAPVAGICHKRGVNAPLPSVWLLYVTVADLDASLSHCERLGGTILRGPTAAGPHGRFAVISDPSGAITGLYQSVG